MLLQNGRNRTILTKNMEKRKSKKGKVNQKMIAFRLDIENEFWLNCQPNKGRYINNLIQQDRLKIKKEE